MGDIRNEIKSRIAASGLTLKEVVERINAKRPACERTTSQNITNKLARGTIRYSEVKEMAAAMGYEIRWVKSNQ